MKTITIKKACLALMAAVTVQTAHAGGMLTNTNQNVAFLRNPARDGAIGIDGVYSNPAGVAFLNNGMHLSINWQAAWQTRQIDTTNPLFQFGVQNNGQQTKHYEGNATAPFIPSVQAAYNTGKWSFQFNFAVHGGGGKCTFDNGLGSFENAVGQIATGLSALGATGYDMDSYMQGHQYYFGFTLGAAYKFNSHLSGYVGLRGLYGSASYKAKLDNIQVRTQQAMVPFNTFLGGAQAQVAAGIAQIEQVIAKYGDQTPAQYISQYQTLLGTQQQLNALDVYAQGVNLQADQTGFGIAPILGIDYKIGAFNFAAKYEFRTKMSMKNSSTLKEAMAIDAINKYQDGASVREDNPAALAVGAQWSVIPSVRINAGYHHFYDTYAKRYNDEQLKLKNGTDEYLGGVEWEPIKKLTVSGGFQITRYGNTDEFMNDMSFVVDSWSFGVGAKYQFNDKVAVQAGYFQTNYDHYKTATNAAGVSNDFYRTNKVAGIGVDITL